MNIAYLPSKEAFTEFYVCLLRNVGLTFSDVSPLWMPAVERTYHRFANIKNKYYMSDDGRVALRAAHIGHSVLFIYELSRLAYAAKDHYLADRLFFLNNAINGVNILPSIDLPLRSFCDHPNGAIIGRANFNSCRSFSFSNQCTIGNSNNVYPTISGDLVMLPGCVLLGDTVIEGHVIMSNGCKIRNAGRLKNCIVYGEYPNNVIREISSEKFYEVASFKQELNERA